MKYSKGDFRDDLFYYFVYSSMGWAVESVYCSVGERQIINRGFLLGPICPIYGAGATVFSKVLGPIKKKYGKTWYSHLISAAVSAVSCDAIEYVTSYAMEKLFHARWWDYSGKKFNIKGRVALSHSFYWAGFGLIFEYRFEPWFRRHVDSSFTADKKNKFLAVAVPLFILDFTGAVLGSANIGKFTKKLENVTEQAKSYAEWYSGDAREQMEPIAEKTVETVKKAAGTIKQASSKAGDGAIQKMPKLPDFDEIKQEFESVQKAYSDALRRKVPGEKIKSTASGLKQKVVDKISARQLKSVGNLKYSIRNGIMKASDAISDLSRLAKNGS